MLTWTGKPVVSLPDQTACSILQGSCCIAFWAPTSREWHTHLINCKLCCLSLSSICMEWCLPTMMLAPSLATPTIFAISSTLACKKPMRASTDPLASASKRLISPRLSAHKSIGFLWMIKISFIPFYWSVYSDHAQVDLIYSSEEVTNFEASVYLL